MIWALAACMDAQRIGSQRSAPQEVVEQEIVEQPLLNTQDLQVLARCGYVLVPEFLAVRMWKQIHGDLYQAVADLAAKTFHLACPPGTTDKEIASFIEDNLTAQALKEAVEVDGARICIATVHQATPPWERTPGNENADGLAEGNIVAYTLVFPRAPQDVADAAGDSTNTALAYVSKCYALPQFHGSGVAGALMEYALEDAREAWGARQASLGTNRANKRATRFYRRLGFRKSGKRRFRVGDRWHDDFVFVRDLTPQSSE